MKTFKTYFASTTLQDVEVPMTCTIDVDVAELAEAMNVVNNTAIATVGLSTAIVTTEFPGSADKRVILSGSSDTTSIRVIVMFEDDNAVFYTVDVTKADLK